MTFLLTDIGCLLNLWKTGLQCTLKFIDNSMLKLNYKLNNLCFNITAKMNQRLMI